MRQRDGHFHFNFNVLSYALPEEREGLSDLLEAQGVSPVFALQALRRRQYWAVTLPSGLFENEFRPGFGDRATEIALRDALFESAHKDFGLRIRVNRLIFNYEGDLYYHQQAIGVLRRPSQTPAFFNALHAFLRLAQEKPALIKGPRRRNAVVPPAERLRKDSRLGRGLAWTPEEDQVLRQWFGPRSFGDDAGKHVALTDAQWDNVLERLNGMRTRGSVRARIIALNTQLRIALSVNGYIPTDRYDEFWARVLGENPRGPRRKKAVRRYRPITRARHSPPAAPASAPHDTEGTTPPAS